jgi:Flp pilus assembly pilin Flp
MARPLSQLSDRVKSQSGQSATEYAVIIGVIAAIFVLAAPAVGAS